MSATLNKVAVHPSRGVHLNQIVAIQNIANINALAEPSYVAFNTAGWKRVLVEVVFGAGGAQTCTLMPYSYQQYDVLGDEDGQFALAADLVNIEVVGAHGGAANFVINSYGRQLYLLPTAVDGTFSVYVSGLERL